MLTLNGLSDPTYRFDEHRKGGHSIGMAIDLGIGLQWVKGRNQTTQDPLGTGNNPDIAADLASVAGSGWSADRATTLSDKLPDQDDNNQQQAVRDFLALYSLTRADVNASVGTWGALDVKNGGAVRAALFGDGTNDGGLISGVLIGGVGTLQNGSVTGQNPFGNIGLVLTDLGISHETKSKHHNHFHIFLRAPNPVGLNALVTKEEGAPTGTAESEQLGVAAQSLLEVVRPRLGFTEGDVNMLVLDVPPEVPQRYAAVVVAQAAPGGDTVRLKTHCGCLSPCEPDNRSKG